MRVGLFALSGVADGPLFGALLLTRQDRAPVEARSQVFTLGAGAKITAAALGAAPWVGPQRWSVSGQLPVRVGCTWSRGCWGPRRSAYGGRSREPAPI